MKLYVEWSRPIQLKDASKENMIYGIDLSKVNAGTGVYIFGRRIQPSKEVFSTISPRARAAEK